ncbi:Dual specificity protein kinase CLK4 [Paramyrothecium foliicola]|nr:Dual specificity protein kinase CLK4 [Paramyrothecium foliicola]
MVSRKLSSPSRLLQPREFPSDGFEIMGPSQRVEEERLPFYKREDYYPMRIGEVLQDRYQTVAKLGYGTGSTVWLSRDLREQKYWAMKVHINTLQYNQEPKVYRYLSVVDTDHPGRDHPSATWLNFLHKADAIHTDNLLIAITNDSILSTVEENEIYKPSARKKTDDAIIHISQYVLRGAGPLTICDLGQARIGQEHCGNAMPVPYRVPGVILGMTWGNAVDVWSVGLLAWDLLDRESFFRVYDQKSKEQNDAHHLAAMTALVGPPPPEFLKKTEKIRKYWDEDGKPGEDALEEVEEHVLVFP